MFPRARTHNKRITNRGKLPLYYRNARKENNRLRRLRGMDKVLARYEKERANNPT